VALVFDQPDAHHGADKVLALETPMPVFGMSPDFLAGRPKRSDVQPVMFGGEGAVGAPLKGLKQAQEMQAAGAPAEDIFAKTKTPQTTGWFQGPEEKWRFEFSDKDAQFNPEALAKMHGGQGIALDQLMSHPQLFQYYPHLKDVKLQALTPEEEATGLRGSYNPSTNVLKLLRDPEQARGTLMHELQHMIQSKENWAAGGGDEAPSEIAKLSASFKTIDSMIAINKAREKISEESRNKIDQIKKEFEPKLEEAKSGSLEDFKKILEERTAAWNKVNEEQNVATKKLDDEFDKIEQQKKAFNEKADQFKRSFSGYEIYRRLGGETEARNTGQNRLMMDLLARQKSLPTTTQDYPYEGQLVMPKK